MALLNLTITALSPLAFPTRKPGVMFRESLPFIPGAVLYGALGASLVLRGSFDEGLLRAVRCHNAYPARPNDSWVRPLPATGLRKKGEEDVMPIDSLAARVCWEQQEPAGLVYAPTADDGRPLEVVGGFMRSSGNEAYEVPQRVLTRVAINRRRGTSEDQRLYSPLVLSEVVEGAQTQYLGSVVVPDGRAADLKAALEAITHLGARQTTGLGAVKIAISDAAPDTPAAVRDRVVGLTVRFQAQAERYQGFGGKAWTIGGEASIFTVNLLSDAILFEHGWVPTQDFSAAQLHEATKGIKATLLRSFTTTTTVGGWQVQWQRPKVTNIAVRAGSLFVFQADGALRDEDFATLATLQNDGIGERRSEGYGHIRICDEFHLEGL